MFGIVEHCTHMKHVITIMYTGLNNHLEGSSVSTLAPHTHCGERGGGEGRKREGRGEREGGAGERD